MRLPRWSANAWLLLVFGLLLAGLVGEPAYRAITGRKSAQEIQFAKLQEAERKMAMGPAVGDPAPSFTLKSSDGREVRLSDFRGRPVLLSFFCGCYLCRGVATEWEKLQKAPLKHRPVVIGIHYFRPDRLKPFIEESGGKDILYLYDPEKEVGRRWGSTVCPRTWVIDEQGRIVYRHEEEEATMAAAQSPVPHQVRRVLSRSKLQLTAAR
jgi:peroxiredoxin